ncbi:MAG: hypothetical protein ACRDDX_02695 [Cellulosilyticaceae bacterium]
MRQERGCLWMLVMLTRILLGINGVYLMVTGDWFNVWALGAGLLLTFVPDVLKRYLGIHLTKSMVNCVMVFLICSQWLGTYLRAYDWLPWWDVFLHGASGVMMSLVGILIILVGDKKGVLFKEKLYGIISLMMFLTASASAVFWEIFEYMGDTFFGTFAQLGSLTDTMEDMIICVVVAGVFSLLVYVGLKKRKGGYFVRQVEELVGLNTKEGMA